MLTGHAAVSELTLSYHLGLVVVVDTPWAEFGNVSQRV